MPASHRKRESIPEDVDPLERPFKKTAADAYEFLALGVLANVLALLILFAGAAAGLLAVSGPVWAPFVASAAGVSLVAPGLAWGMHTLTLAMARRDDPSILMLFHGFGRPYPRALMYSLLGTLGGVAAGFMVWFWSSTPVWGSSIELGIGGMWLVVGTLGALAHLLGWPVLIRAEGKPLYTLRLVLALFAVDPIAGAGYCLCVFGMTALVVLPLVSKWQGLASGISIMFVSFVSLFVIALLSTNVSLRLVDVLAERKEAAGSDQKPSQSEEE